LQPVPPLQPIPPIPPIPPVGPIGPVHGSGQPAPPATLSADEVAALEDLIMSGEENLGL
jgi:hypothetical protein